MTLSIRASTAETWNARRTPSRNYLSRPRPSKQASTLASARGARIAASEMATPGDALRAQAEVRLQHLRRKVAAHRKVNRFLVALRSLRKARKAKDRDAERWELILSLVRMSLPAIYQLSRACRGFLDEYYPLPDASARVDALRMLALKRLSTETVSGRGLDYATELVAQIVRPDPVGHFPESHHPHVLAARLVFAYWIVSGPADKEKAGHRNLRFRGKTLQYPEDEILSSDARQSLVECVLRADGYDYADYDAADVDHARHTLADAAALWTEKFDSGAKRRYAVAAAAGHGLAGEIVKRLDSTDLAKLSRQYKLDAFAARHLETLPSGLARLEAVLNFAPSNNGARRAAFATSSSADAASVGDSFALADPAARAEPSAFVRASDGSDSWTYHDRRSAVAVGAFVNVIQRCRDGPMLPYLLFYDALPAPPPGN